MKQNLETDFERTLIERVYANLDHNYENLSKRMIVVPPKRLIGQSIYVIPGREAGAVLEEYGVNAQSEVRREEGEYGCKSVVLGAAKLLVDSAHVEQGENVSLKGETSSNTQNNGVILEGRIGKEAAKSEDFSSKGREKVFMMIIFAILSVYIYFRFLSPSN